MVDGGDTDGVYGGGFSLTFQACGEARSVSVSPTVCSSQGRITGTIICRDRS